ncbi:AAA family ATPase [Microbacterium paulum]
MLTKLVVRGFKNLLDISVEFGPYTCIAGANAVGKSNLFDAIEFLALLAEHPFLDAAQRLRPSGERGIDPKTLFSLDRDGEPVRSMYLEAEMLVGPSVTDEFGQSAEPKSSFLRYTIEFEYTTNERGLTGRQGGFALVRETLAPISKGDAHAHLRWPHSAKNFRQSAVFNTRFAGAFISTESQEGIPTLLVHADGGSRGKPRRAPVAGASRSTISSIFSADEPTMLAAKQEMRSWRKLALEPSAMRAPDDAYGASPSVGVDGSHMASVLWKLSQSDPDAESFVTANVSELADVREVRVVEDTRRDVLVLEARLASGPFLPARSLSEGTLRFLALAVIEADPTFGGLICMEEPENGIHPAKIPAMVELLKRLAVDPDEPPGDENPLRQVIVNTHSPEFVRAQEAGDLLFAMPVSYDISGTEGIGVSFFAMSGTWRGRSGLPTATPYSVSSYLSDPRRSAVWQTLQLPLGELDG